MAPKRSSRLLAPRPWGLLSVAERRAHLLGTPGALVVVPSPASSWLLTPRATRAPSRVAAGPSAAPVAAASAPEAVLVLGRADFARVREVQLRGQGTGVVADGLTTHGLDEFFADLHADREAASGKATTASYLHTWTKLHMIRGGEGSRHCALLILPIPPRNLLAVAAPLKWAVIVAMATTSRQLRIVTLTPGIFGANPSRMRRGGPLGQFFGVLGRLVNAWRSRCTSSLNLSELILPW